MSSSNCCFLTCIQISQEAGKVVWYSHLLKYFPQFVVIHTVKGFGTVNKAEVDVFLELSGFFNKPTDVGNYSLVPLPFLKPAWTSESSWFTYCWRLAWELWALPCKRMRWVQLCSSLSIRWHCLSLGLEWKLTFSVLWPLLSFPNLLAYWVQHFSIFALRSPWTVWKVKKMVHWKMNSPGW